MSPARLALCDLEAPGWGALVSAYDIFVICCSLLFYFATPIHWLNIPLPPVLPRVSVSLIVLLYLVPGFSGRRLVRTVSTSPLHLFHCCPLVLET